MESNSRKFYIILMYVPLLIKLSTKDPSNEFANETIFDDNLKITTALNRKLSSYFVFSIRKDL